MFIHVDTYLEMVLFVCRSDRSCDQSNQRGISLICQSNRRSQDEDAMALCQGTNSCFNPCHGFVSRHQGVSLSDAETAAIRTGQRIIQGLTHIQCKYYRSQK
jgi:hypothetical protein